MLGVLAVLPAQGQVLLNDDFDSAAPFCYSNTLTSGHEGDVFPTDTETIVEVGSPYGYVLKVNVDSSQTQFPWNVSYELGMCPGAAPNVTFDRVHTFLKCDVLVSKPKPVHLRLGYNSGSGSIILDAAVTPALTGAFQTFLLPLSAFTNYFSWGTSFPQFPTEFDLVIYGDPSDPATTWPAAADNWFMVDNLSYIVQPPLSIATFSNAVAVSWPTNTAGFVLQQSTDLNNWTVVTNAPVVSGAVNQVVLTPGNAEGFFRLSGP